MDTIHRVTTLPTFVPKVAHNLPIRPVGTFHESVWGVVARPLTGRSGIRKVRTAARPELATGNKTGDIVMNVQREQDALRVADDLSVERPSTVVTVCEINLFAGVPAGTGTIGGRGW